MTTETQVSTAPETQIPASVTTEQPVVVEPEGTDSPAQEGDESGAKPEKTADQKELERLRRALTKRDRTQGRMHQELQAEREARVRLEQSTRQGNEPGEERQEPQVDHHKLAREIATVDRVVERSNALANEYKAKHGDFDAVLNAVIEEAGPLIADNGHPTALGEVILEASDKVSLLRFLGTNPEIAAELEGLSPTQLGRRIERIEAQMKTTTAKPVSKASEPINPIKGGNGNVVKSPANMSMDEYKAFRAKQGAKWAR